MFQQLLVAVAGLLMVRSLSKGDYGVYALLASFAIGVAQVGDAGVTAAVTQRWNELGDESSRQYLLRQSIRFRSMATLLSLLIAIPVLFFLLAQADRETRENILACSALLIAALTLASMQFYQVVLRLRLRFVTSATISLGSAAFRLIFISAITVLLSEGRLALLMFTIPICASFEVFLVLICLRRQASAGSLPHQTSSEKRRLQQIEQSSTHAQIKRSARLLMPNKVFFVIQGQLVFAVLTWSGDIQVVGELSALGRYALAFSVISVVIGNVLSVLASRAGTELELRQLIFRGVCAYIALSFCAFCLLSFSSTFALALLGPGYEALHRELLLVNLSAVFAGVGSTLATVNQARGWYRLEWVNIPLTLVWTYLLFLVVGVDSLLAAATLIAFLPLSGVAVQVLGLILGWKERFSSGTLSDPENEAQRRDA